MELNADDVGRWFRTRDGRLARIESRTGVHYIDAFPYSGHILGLSEHVCWAIDGKYWVNENRKDLVCRIDDDVAHSVLVSQSFKDL